MKDLNAKASQVFWDLMHLTPVVLMPPEHQQWLGRELLIQLDKLTRQPPSRGEGDNEKRRQRSDVQSFKTKTEFEAQEGRITAHTVLGSKVMFWTKDGTFTMPKKQWAKFRPQAGFEEGHLAGCSSSAQRAMIKIADSEGYRRGIETAAEIVEFKSGMTDTRYEIAARIRAKAREGK